MERECPQLSSQMSLVCDSICAKLVPSHTESLLCSLHDLLKLCLSFPPGGAEPPPELALVFASVEHSLNAAAPFKAPKSSLLIKFTSLLLTTSQLHNTLKPKPSLIYASSRHFSANQLYIFTPSFVLNTRPILDSTQLSPTIESHPFASTPSSSPPEHKHIPRP